MVLLRDIETLLERFAHFGIELGLERIERLLQALGNPQLQVPIVHVAGSNGKGSVCAYLSSVLKAAGYRVGRYISPHLVDWTERISINDQAIAPATLHQALQKVMAAIQPDVPSPTQFEVITAAAWLYFAEQEVDLAVVEVGLGGRLDATNVCDRPLVSVITSLSMEHWQRLGPTLADISREKAGILKPGCPAAIAPQPPEAEAVLKQRLAELNCPTVWVQPARDLGQGWAEYQAVGTDSGEDRQKSDAGSQMPGVGSQKSGAGSQESEFGSQNSEVKTQNSTVLKYPLPLPGAHQLTNSAVAIAALQILRSQGWNIDDAAIINGMANTHWAGRLQWTMWNDSPLLIDGAHNPAGAAALRDYLDSSDRVTRPVQFVMGMLGTKDHGDVFKALLRTGDRLSLVPVPDHAPADLEELAGLAQTICPNLADCSTYPDVLDALHQSVVTSHTAETTTVLCGSLYLIGHFFRILNK